MSSKSEEPKPNHFQSYFSNLVGDLLEQLSHSFEDCESTKQTFQAFDSHIKDHDQHEIVMLKNWHEIMTPFYKSMVQNPVNGFEECLNVLMDRAEKMEDISIPDLVAKIVVANLTKNQKEIKKYETLLYDPVYILKQVRLREKWRDPSFDDDSRRYIVCYMLHLNGFAILYNIVPDELFDAAQAQGMKMMGNLDSSLDPQKLFQDTCNQMPQVPYQTFMQNMPMFMLAISCLSGAGLEGGNMLMTLLQSSGPMTEQLGPMKNVLNMALPLLSKIPPETFQNMTQIMESEAVQNMLQSGGQGLPNIDPNLLQSMMRPEMLASMFQNVQNMQHQKASNHQRLS